MQAYSLDLRQKVVSAYENGPETIVEVAERFEISPSFIKKLLAQKRATGDLSPIGHRGGQRQQELRVARLRRRRHAQRQQCAGQYRLHRLDRHGVLPVSWL